MEFCNGYCNHNWHPIYIEINQNGGRHSYTRIPSTWNMCMWSYNNRKLSVRLLRKLFLAEIKRGGERVRKERETIQDKKNITEINFSPSNSPIPERVGSPRPKEFHLLSSRAASSLNYNDNYISELVVE